jgi:hypothetical protein
MWKTPGSSPRHVPVPIDESIEVLPRGGRHGPRAFAGFACHGRKAPGNSEK